MNPSQRRLLERIDGFRSVEQILAMSGDVIGVHAALGKLIAANLVTIDSTQATAPVAEVRALVVLQIQMDNHKLAMRKQDDERERELRLEAARNAYAAAMAEFKAKTVRVVRSKVITDGPLKGKKHADLFAVVDAATRSAISLPKRVSICSANVA